MRHRLLPLLRVWIIIAAPLAVMGVVRTLAADTDAPPIYLEDSLAAQDLIDDALADAGRGEYPEAVRKLQRVIETYPHKLVERETQLHEDARPWTMRRIREDAPLLEAYRNQFTAPAQRQLEQALRAPRHADEQALRLLLEQHALTEPGLEAGLTLAGLHLTRAKVHSATGVLRELAEHPDLANHQGRYHHLSAQAAMLTGDAAQAERHRQHLIDLGDQSAVASLQAMATRLALPGAVAPSTAGPAPDADALAGAGEAVLWEQEIRWDPMSLGESVRNRGGPRGDDEALLAMLPIVDGARVYINEGRQVRAVDLHAGEVRWTFHWTITERWERLSPMLRMSRTAPARRGVLLHDGRLFAVLGAASTLNMGAMRDALPTALVNLDPHTGEAKWQISPEQLDDSFARGYFLGTPLAGEGCIYVVVRRSQNAGFQDTFVAAVDHERGELLWRRHLSSMAMAGGLSTGPEPQMTSRDGVLYVSDNLGVVAAMAERNGEMHWLRVMIAPGSDMERHVAGLRRGEQQPIVAPPVLVEAGLILPATTATAGQALRLDARTGEPLDRLGGTVWTDSTSLLTFEGDVLAIGTTVTRFDGRTMRTKWTGRLDAESRRATAEPVIVGNVLLVPAERQIVLIDLATGNTLSQLTMQETGHLAAADGQIIVASQRALRSYMTWPEAAARLRKQMAAQPTALDPALALATLALQHGEHDALLEGVDAAAAALHRLADELTWDDAAPAAYLAQQQRLFDHLLRFTDDQRLIGTSLRGTLFDRMAALTRGPRQEATYHLRVARFLHEQNRPGQAAGHLQMVLQVPVLGAELFDQQDVSRQASIEARQQLRDLIETHGPQVYAQFAEQAVIQLRQLAEADGPAGAFIALAERYPLAQAAAVARAEAALRLARANDLAGAVVQFRRAYEQTHDVALRAQIVGALAHLHESTGHPEQAAAWLRRFERQHPGHDPVRGSESVDLDIWLAGMERASDDTGALPALKQPLGEPRLLEGWLVAPMRVEHDLEAQAERLPRGVLTRQGAAHRWHTDNELAEQWSLGLPFEDTRLLGGDAEQLLLWSPTDRKLAAVDVETGALLWPVTDAQSLLAQVGEARRATMQQEAERQQFIMLVQQNRPIRVEGGRLVMEAPERPEGEMVAVGDQAVAIADASGRAVGVDRATGRVLWRMHAPMETILHVGAERDLVVLAGVNGLGTDASAGVIYVLDIASGEALHPAIEQKEPVSWVGFARDDMLLFAAGGGQVTAYRLDDGGVAWRLDTPASPLSGRGWVNRDLLVLMDQEGMALTIDPHSGELLNRVDVQADGQIESVHAAVAEQTWYIMTPRKVTALDARGQVRWRDAIVQSGQTLVQQMVGRDYVVVVSAPSGAGERMGMVDRGVGIVNVEGVVEQMEIEQWVAERMARQVEQQQRGQVQADLRAQLAELRLLLEQDDLPLARRDAIEQRLQQLEGRQAAGDVPAARGGGASPGHRIYLLDRQTGVLVAEHELVDLPEPIATRPGLLRANRLVLPLQGPQTLIVPGG